MEVLVNALVDLVTKLVSVFAAGDADKEREAMIHVASALSDRAFKLALGKPVQ